MDGDFENFFMRLILTAAKDHWERVALSLIREELKKQYYLTFEVMNSGS